MVTNRFVKPEGYGVMCSCREYTHPRNDKKKLTWKDFLKKVTPNFGPRWNSQNTLVVAESRSEIDEMKRVGTQSCVVISRSVEKYVTEHALDHTQPMHHDGMSASAGRRETQFGAVLDKTITYLKNIYELIILFLMHIGYMRKLYPKYFSIATQRLHGIFFCELICSFATPTVDDASGVAENTLGKTNIGQLSIVHVIICFYI